MFYKSPEYVDNLIMSQARRGMVNDPTPIAAAHAAQQARDLASVEGMGKSLGLQKQRLDLRQQGMDEGARQFDANQAFMRGQMSDAADQGRLATLISAGGLGVGVARDYAERQRAQERMASINNSIQQLQSTGDANSVFLANLLRGINNGY